MFDAAKCIVSIWVPTEFLDHPGTSSLTLWAYLQ
jgi:hypothetical protein